MPDAASTEDDPNTKTPLLTLAYCTVDKPGERRLSGKLKIKIEPDTLAYRIYGKTDIEEPFNCNYELNPDYREKLEKAGLKVSGVSETGGARIIELQGHPFFMATGFVPQFNSEKGKPHPLIVEFLRAAAQ